ncbi:hypothetical protein BBJ28_00005125 [Nothophytophthora sp. Chile5]|nr:hypothetical protein BBJ28_00005125 [Nothophytophthora sp. Chile5]
MLLPDCDDLFSPDGSLLVCARSLSFGTFCLVTLVAAIYGFQRILPIFLSSQWYLANLCMLALAVLQMALLAYECLIQNSPKILVLAKYFRGIQVAISCVLYGKSAGELLTLSRSRLFYNALIPVVGLTTLAMTAVAALVVGTEDEVDCHHFTWLAMSITGECDSMFFSEDTGLLEQSVRLVISIVTYLVPNWAVLYVFYVLPRFQFSTVLDVPGLLEGEEGDEAAYELLPNDNHDREEPRTRSAGRNFY